MTISDFVAQYSARFADTGQPGAAIQKRWTERMVARGWHLKGPAGAEKYLQQYGNGLGHEKAALLAAIASRNGCQAVANRFWSEAFFIFTGHRECYPSALTQPAPALVLISSAAYAVWDDDVPVRRAA